LQWSTIGQKVTIDCIYENVEPEMKLSWLKNEEPLFFDPRISFSRNETRLQIDDVKIGHILNDFSKRIIQIAFRTFCSFNKAKRWQLLRAS